MKHMSKKKHRLTNTVTEDVKLDRWFVNENFIQFLIEIESDRSCKEL